MSKRDGILAAIDEHLDTERFKQQHWEGSFFDYLDLVIANPRLLRNAFQRVYDMILHFGTDRYTAHKQEVVHYKFFDDPFEDGADAVTGLRNGSPNPVAARAGGLEQEHDRTAAEEGVGVLQPAR